MPRWQEVPATSKRAALTDLPRNKVEEYNPNAPLHTTTFGRVEPWYDTQDEDMLHSMNYDDRYADVSYPIDQYSIVIPPPTFIGNFQHTRSLSLVHRLDYAMALPYLPLEIQLHILSFSDPVFLWGTGRQVSRAFKQWSEELFYENHLQWTKLWALWT